MFCGIAPTRGWFGIAAASCIFYVWFLRSHGSVAHPCSSRKRAGCDRVPDHRHDTVVQLDDSLIFLRGKEQVTGHAIIGTVAVVLGTIAIALGK